MADHVVLAAATHREPTPSQGRGKGRLLNTIMEDDNEDTSPRRLAHQRRRPQPAAAELTLERMLSPMSDHFPTPRGFHFLSAPILPSSPSAASADEADDNSFSPDSFSTQPSSNPWNRASGMTDATEFDDLYDVSSDEEERRKSQVRTPRGRGGKVSQRSSDSSFEDNRRALPQLVIPAQTGTSNETWSAQQEWKRITSPVVPTPTSKVPMSPAMMDFMQAQHSLEVPTVSAPPSLDGSLNSEQLAQMSAPPTPIIGGRDEEDQNWDGVQLQPGAMATLQALSTLSSPSSDVDYAEQVIEVPSPNDGSRPGPPQNPPRPLSEMTEVRRPPSVVLAELRRRSQDCRRDESVEGGSAEMEMSTAAQRPLSLFTNIQRSSMLLPPPQNKSLAGLTRLDIPSPGGFFSGLSPRTRHTWHMPGQTPIEESGPPTSTTAEQFYKIPWNSEDAPPLPTPAPAPSRAQVSSLPPRRPLHMTNGSYSTSPVEQFVVIQQKTDEPQGAELGAARSPGFLLSPEPMTARNVLLPTPAGVSSAATLADSSSSPIDDVVATEIVTDYDPEYARKQQKVALSHFDRTELWLVAQRVYLKGVTIADEELSDEAQAEVKKPVQRPVEREVPPTPPPKDKEEDKKVEASPAAALTSTSTAVTLARKKTVRFSENVKSPSVPKKLPSRLLHLESAYYRAFTDWTVRCKFTDGFINRLPRFEALQAQRLCLRESHRNQLLGKYQLSVVPQSAKKRMSANVVRGDDILFDDPAKMRADKEVDALSQMALATWNIMAWKLLNGGLLTIAPIHKRLARLSRMPPGRSGVARDRARILDLGGQTTCDWAWHAALAYPNTKIYTVTTRTVRQLSNSNIRGPPNHRQVTVNRLTKLPFANDQFDLVRAADLQSVLKFVGENGEDEWESCLHEVLRILKPGGFLEFTLMDSDIMNAGKLGNAKGVEFGFCLKTLGYDPTPTRFFISRLQRAGFDAVRRAWLCLPMGPKPSSASPLKQQQQQQHNRGSGSQTLDLEAMVMGSADHVAAVTGLAAGWAWERWLLRAEMEAQAGELRLADLANPGEAMREAGKSLEDVHAIVEEGRACGAGWRVLKGHARKPRHGEDKMGLIDMVLDMGMVG